MTQSQRDARNAFDPRNNESHGSHEAHEASEARLWSQALWIIAASTLIRMVFGAVVPLFPDESYYWEWSRRLAGGYFDHPPVIAWLIAGGTALLGDTPIGVRLLPMLAGTATAFALASAACRLAGAGAARTVALIFALLPLSAAGYVLATPDAPLLAAIAWTLLALLRVLEHSPGEGGATRWWVIAGIAIGLAMASKFTGVFIPFAVMLAVLVRPQLRGWLRTPGPYLAVVVASVVMVPVLYWNATHDWIAFRFQLGHGLGTTAKGSWISRELNLLGGQAGLITPILFVLMIGTVWRAMRDRTDQARFVLGMIATFCGLFFVYSATRRSVEANWPAIAWLPAMLLLATEQGTDAIQRWTKRGLTLAGTLTALVLVHVVQPYLPLPARRDQVSKAHGWEPVAAEVQRVRDSYTSGAPTLHLAADRYQDASKLAFHLADHPTVYSVNLGGRKNHYDLWPTFPEEAKPGDDLLLLIDEPAEGVPKQITKLLPYFGGASSRELVPLKRNGEEVGRRRIWVMRNWSGQTWSEVRGQKSEVRSQSYW